MVNLSSVIRRPSIGPDTLGPVDTIPERGVRATAPVAEGVEGGAEGIGVELADGEDRPAGAFEDPGEVLDERGQARVPRATAEEEPGASHGRRAGLAEQRDEATADVGVIPE